MPSIVRNVIADSPPGNGVAVAVFGLPNDEPVSGAGEGVAVLADCGVPVSARDVAPPFTVDNSIPSSSAPGQNI